MSWSKYPETKPNHDAVCYVCNTKMGWKRYLCYYDERKDCFTLAAQVSYNSYDGPVEVTHYIELPGEPLE